MVNNSKSKSAEEKEPKTLLQHELFHGRRVPVATFCIVSMFWVIVIVDPSITTFLCSG